VFPEIHIIDEDDVGYTWYLIRRLCVCDVRNRRFVKRAEVSRDSVRYADEIEIMRVPTASALSGVLIVDMRLSPRYDYCSFAVRFYADDVIIRSATGRMTRYAYPDTDVIEYSFFLPGEYIDYDVVNRYWRDPVAYEKAMTVNEVSIRLRMWCDADNLYVSAALYA
jgi:hypothetical protein